MKCSTAQRLINEHVDNLLKTEQVLQLESHIQECRNCREFFADMKSIVKNSRYLESPGVSGDLWPGIKRGVLTSNRKISEQKKIVFRNFPVRTKGVAFAVGSLLVILVLISFSNYYFPNMPWEERDSKKIVLNHFELAEQHYQSAVKVLDGAIKDMDVTLSPKLTKVFKKNLELIDDSIRACKEAIEHSPENLEANRLLMICYRKKIELLDEIKELTTRAG